MLNGPSWATTIIVDKNHAMTSDAADIFIASDDDINNQRRSTTASTICSASEVDRLTCFGWKLLSICYAVVYKKNETFFPFKYWAYKQLQKSNNNNGFNVIFCTLGDNKIETACPMVIMFLESPEHGESNSSTFGHWNQTLSNRLSQKIVAFAALVISYIL